MKKQKPYFVGISGGSGSGKTTLLRQLVKYFGAEKLTLISQDNYYISKDDLPRDLDGEINFAHPSAIDLDAMAKDLHTLMQGKQFELQEYTFNNPELDSKTLVFKPSEIIVIEGLFVFNHPQVNEMLDLKVFVETSPHLRLSRRIKRDARERGYSLDEVLSYYERFVVPMYKEFIEPFRTKCDIVIPNDKHMEVATKVLIHHLDAEINANVPAVK